MNVIKLSDKELKITKSSEKIVQKEVLENNKIQLEEQLKEVNDLLAYFNKK